MSSLSQNKERSPGSCFRGRGWVQSLYGLGEVKASSSSFCVILRYMILCPQAAGPFQEKSLLVMSEALGRNKWLLMGVRCW